MTIIGGHAEAALAQRSRRPYEEALAQCGVLEVLVRFDPRVAGTPPLRLDLLGSDIDVLCFTPDIHIFIETVWCAFSEMPGFTAKQWVEAPRPVVVSFEVLDWRIELYGESISVEQQRGWRHFLVERRLLKLGGEDFRLAVLALRRRGRKTEPAFADALNLEGDPYLALLHLGEQNDETLISTLRARGFRGFAA